MEEIKKYLSMKSGLPEPPDGFLSWRDIDVKGNRIIAKDAVIRHSADEAGDDWPGVSIQPGNYALSLKLFRHKGFNRVAVYRICLCGSNPVRGKAIGEVEVDFAVVGFSDYDRYIEAVRKNEDDYEDHADDLFDLMEEMFGVDEFHGEKVYFVSSGYGDGVYPVYELEEDGKVVGLECDFLEEIEE